MRKKLWILAALTMLFLCLFVSDAMAARCPNCQAEGQQWDNTEGMHSLYCTNCTQISAHDNGEGVACGCTEGCCGGNHSLTVVASENVLDATCNNCVNVSVLLTLKADDSTYNARSYAGAYFQGNEEWTDVGLRLPTIKYVGSGYAESDTPPTNAGNYTAKAVYDASTIATANFTIAKKELTVTGTTVDSKEYDGNTEATSISFGTPQGIQFEDDVSIAGSTGSFSDANAGTGKNVTVTYTLTGDDAHNYTVKNSTVSGNIDPILEEVTVTITGNTNTVSYDGNEYTVDGYGFDSNNTLFIDSYVAFSGTASVSGTDVTTANEGKYLMGLSDSDFANNSGNFSNVKFEVTDGYLKIDPISDEVTVTITGNTKNVFYNGDEHTVTGYDFDSNNALFTDSYVVFSGTASVSGTDVTTENDGKHLMGLSDSNFANNSGNFSNVKFEVTDGYLKINPRTVTLTSATDTKRFDESPLTNNTVTATEYDEEAGTGFIEGEGYSADVTGSQTDVGSSYNTFTYEFDEGTKECNYVITKAEGTLTVMEAASVKHPNRIYSSGDKVKFTLSATNAYDTPIIITFKAKGMTFSGKSTFKNVQPGETVTAVASYTVTSRDEKNGSVTKTFTVKIGDKEYTMEDTVEDIQSAKTKYGTIVKKVVQTALVVIVKLITSK